MEFEKLYGEEKEKVVALSKEIANLEAKIKEINEKASEIETENADFRSKTEKIVELAKKHGKDSIEDVISSFEAKSEEMKKTFDSEKDEISKKLAETEKELASVNKKLTNIDRKEKLGSLKIEIGEDELSAMSDEAFDAVVKYAAKKEEIGVNTNDEIKANVVKEVVEKDVAQKETAPSVETKATIGDAEAQQVKDKELFKTFSGLMSK